MRTISTLVLLLPLLALAICGCAGLPWSPQVPFHRWNARTKSRDWHDLARFLDGHAIQITLPQYVTRDTVETSVFPEVLGIGTRPLRLAERSAADVWPIALELALAERLSKVHHDEFGWWLLWLLQPVGGDEETFGPRPPLRYARQAAVMRRIVAAGIRLETEYAPDAFAFPDEEGPAPAGFRSIRLPGRRPGGRHRTLEAMCNHVLEDPVSPFHGLRGLPSVRECLGPLGAVRYDDPRRKQRAVTTRNWIRTILAQGPLPHLGVPPLHGSTVDAYTKPVDRFGNSLLDIAAMVGNSDAIFSFIRLVKEHNEWVRIHAGSANKMDPRIFLERPLHFAVIHGQDRVVRLLLDAGLRALPGSVHLAARGGHLGVLRHLVRSRPDLEARIQGDQLGSFTPAVRRHQCTDCDPEREGFELGLHETCCPAEDAIVKRALEARRDELTLRCDASREAELLTTAWSGPAFRKIALGADAIFTPAAPLSFHSLERIFLETANGTFAIHVFYPFKTPLMTAAEYGRAEVVDELIRMGADVNAGTGGLTALVYAAKYGYVDIVERLLLAGAKLTGDQPIEDEADVLSPFADSDACRRNPALFAQSGQRIRTRWSYRQEHHPLRNAAREGHLQVTRLLLSLMTDFRFNGVVTAALFDIADLDVLDYPAIRKLLKHHLDQHFPAQPRLRDPNLINSDLDFF